MEIIQDDYINHFYSENGQTNILNVICPFRFFIGDTIENRYGQYEIFKIIINLEKIENARRISYRCKKIETR